MTYKELRETQQERVNDFLARYGFFAFSDAQFAKGLEKLGTDQLAAVPGGGYIRSDQAEAFKTMLQQTGEELREAMRDPDFAFDAFRSELANTEYSFTGETDEMYLQLGLSRDEIQKDAVMREALEKALASLG